MKPGYRIRRVVENALPTPRELEVLKLIAAGRLNKQMAEDLGISIKTIEKHRQRLFQKFPKPTTAAGMCVQAMRSGLIR